VLLHHVLLTWNPNTNAALQPLSTSLPNDVAGQRQKVNRAAVAMATVLLTQQVAGSGSIFELAAFAGSESCCESWQGNKNVERGNSSNVPHNSAGLLLLPRVPHCFSCGFYLTANVVASFSSKISQKSA